MEVTLVSPRPAPTRDDDTARQFLDAAADLIDAYLRGTPLENEQVARLRHTHFPAALDWLRVEDVIRVAAADHGEGVSRKAFFNRWPTREDFLPEAVIHALNREHVADSPQEHAERASTKLQSATVPSAVVVTVADALLRGLLPYPRSYLVLHLGPLLPRHTELWRALLPSIRAAIEIWHVSYERFLDMHDLVLRPEWTIERVGLVFQAILDGFVLRYRVQPDDLKAAERSGVSAFADGIVTFILGAVDWERSGVSARRMLDIAIDTGTVGETP